MAKHDLVIRNGNIVDGTGTPAREGDLAIVGGVVRQVGVVDGDGTREIDARGLPRHSQASSTSTPITTRKRPGIPYLMPSSLHGVTTRRHGQLRGRLRAGAHPRPRPV